MVLINMKFLILQNQVINRDIISVLGTISHIKDLVLVHAHLMENLDFKIKKI